MLRETGPVVDVFSLRPPDGEALERLAALLTDDERARAARYRRPVDAALSITARALARLTLAHAARGRGLRVAPARFAFGLGEHGKPEVSGPPDGLGLLFNVSHTEGLTVCAVAVAGEVEAVGVDVERADRRTSHVDLARRFFAPEEAAEVEAAPEGAERVELFFRFWTLKEAYLKARGVGLGLELDSFRFRLHEGPWPLIAFAPKADDDEAGWAFAAHRGEGGHLLAAGARRRLPGRPLFRFHPEGTPA